MYVSYTLFCRYYLSIKWYFIYMRNTQFMYINGILKDESKNISLKTYRFKKKKYKSAFPGSSVVCDFAWTLKPRK